MSEIRIDDNGLAGALLSLGAQLRDQKVLNRMGARVVRFITSRTRRGVDWQGDAFRPYSEGHLKRRREANITNPGRVTLQFSNVSRSGGGQRSAMEEIEHVVSGLFTGVEVRPASDRAAEILGYHNVLGAGKSKVLRVNFRINEGEEVKLAKIYETHLERLLGITGLFS